MERILLDENKDKKNEFKKAVENVMNKANGLINAFHKYQTFKKVEKFEDFQALCMKPIETFDDTILKFIQIPSNGLKINSEKLCELYSIDRPGYIDAFGLADREIEDCVGCNKSRSKVKGEYSYIKYGDFLELEPFLTFDNGYFVLNQERIDEKLNSFHHYIENQEQIKLYKTWETLLNTLNELMARGLSKSVNLQKLCEMFPGIKYVDNILYLNMEIIKYQIYKLK